MSNISMLSAVRSLFHISERTNSPEYEKLALAVRRNAILFRNEAEGRVYYDIITSQYTNKVSFSFYRERERGIKFYFYSPSDFGCENTRQLARRIKGILKREGIKRKRF